MLHGKKVVVVMPAFNAEKTLMATYEDVPKDIVDRIILVDDASSDATADVAERLGLSVFVHDHNLGYGGNQKTCYSEAIEAGADIVVMTHPDYQYTPKLITAMSAMIASGEFDVVLGSRILGVGALAGGMPRHKYVANRFLTFVQNVFLNHKLSEYHTGSTTRYLPKPYSSASGSASSPAQPNTSPTPRPSASSEASNTASASSGPASDSCSINGASRASAFSPRMD